VHLYIQKAGVQVSAMFVMCELYRINNNMAAFGRKALSFHIMNALSELQGSKHILELMDVWYYNLCIRP
jgi:hypothetical protein